MSRTGSARYSEVCAGDLPRPGHPVPMGLTFGGKETVAHEQGRFYKNADPYGPQRHCG
ncbi:MAG: hypothetical protein CM1200mP41_25290 [Gammaproteobacteria bacterium]|nr:MAG: hypothetical protein CM1200mP41_25290 [Gammaproteobacteria bacterium]